MSNPNIKYRVELTSEQREELIEISKNGKKTAKQVNHANVLLMADDNAVTGRWRDEDISQALNMHINTVASIRKKFVLEGVKPALQRKYRETPPNPPKLDGKQEAHLIAICCSDPPAGRVRWTMQLLAKELVARKIIMSISQVFQLNLDSQKRKTIIMSAMVLNQYLCLSIRSPDGEE
jgi:Homeodomain-like domain